MALPLELINPTLALLSGLSMSTSYHFPHRGQGQSFYNINGNGIHEGRLEQVRTLDIYVCNAPSCLWWSQE